MLENSRACLLLPTLKLQALQVVSTKPEGSPIVVFQP